MDKRLEAFGKLLEVMDSLREKCPWDREQTFETLRNNTIEETFELVDALIDNNMDGIREELGDMLLHIVFYSKIASEQNSFDVADVANGVCDKLIYRHPHVFGDVEANTSDAVMRNWEALKLKEKSKKGRGVLSGVPRSLPALVKAYRIGQKASSAGFDWEQKEEVWDKVTEEIEELRHGMVNEDKKCIEEEFGDLLFSMVNVARLYGIDPEAALEKCNRKFISRFSYIEDEARKQGKTVNELPFEQMEEAWQKAKNKKTE